MLRSDAWRGLSIKEAKRRLGKYRNRQPHSHSGVLIKVLWHQLASPLLYILLLAGVLAGILGHERDVWLIGAIFLVNFILGAAQEYKADRALDSLRRMMPQAVRVVRSGDMTSIAADELVPGDIVVVEAGEKVPADIRLIRTEDLEVDESQLTGESLPVTKTTEVNKLAGRETRVQPNILYWGSLVTRGHAYGVVIATGDKIHFAQTLLAAEHVIETESGLGFELRKLSRVILIVSLLLAILVFVSALWRDTAWQDGFSLMVNIFVAVIPEGLQVAATVVLTMAALRMAHHKALVRKLSAAEMLGNIDLVLVDKTGTLTLGQMMVREIWAASGATKILGSEKKLSADICEVVRAGVLANQASLTHRLSGAEGFGDGIDVAFLKLGHRLGLAREVHRKSCLDILPFDHSRRLVASLCKVSEGCQLFAKGAPEEVLKVATHMLRSGRKTKLTQADRDTYNSIYRHMAAQGQRVVAVASKTMPKGVTELADHDIAELTILGLVGIEDAPRHSAKSIIGELRQAGVAVKMVTGDLPATAYAVAREVGIAQDLQGILSGSEVDKALQSHRRLDEVDVFARVLPETKMALVKYYQSRGRRVAMIGDGLNDAAALKIADIGVAMVRDGAEVARETADLAIVNDRLGTLKMAISEGQDVWLKLRKILFFLLSTNLAELAVVLVALWAGWPIPFSPVQILWINIITDLAIGQALIVGRVDGKISTHDRELIPRWLIYYIVLAAFWIGTITLFVYHRFAAQDIAYATTMAFIVLVAMQVANAYNGCALATSVFTTKWWRHGWMHVSSLVVLAVTVLSVSWTPLREFLGLATITTADFVRLLVLSLSVVGFLEVAKLWYIKREKD